MVIQKKGTFISIHLMMNMYLSSCWLRSQKGYWIINGLKNEDMGQNKYLLPILQGDRKIARM
jgi:hypothetical protein